MHLNKNRRALQPILMLLLTAGLWSSPSLAQVVPSAFRGADTLWVGAEYSNFDASFPYQSNQRLQGIGAFADFNLNAHLGVEGNARFLSFGGFGGVTENTYLIGLPISLCKTRQTAALRTNSHWRRKHSLPIQYRRCKLLCSRPNRWRQLSSTRSMEPERRIRISNSGSNSPGYSNQPDHQLRPNGMNIGVAYRLFR